MNEVLVSVVIPTRNRADLLRRAIAGVLAQTYRNLELIVVNDGSTDHTTESLSAIRDVRLRVLEGGGRGAASARNLGIEAAKGEFVAFHDDDDIWLLEKLEQQLAALHAQREMLWCVCHYIRVQYGHTKYIGSAEHEKLDYSRGVEGDWSLISTPGWVVPRQLLSQLGGFDPRIRSFDDWELGLRLCRFSRPLIVRQPLWIQDRESGGGLIRQERWRANDLRIAMEKHGGDWAHDVTLTARHWERIGRAMSLYDPPPSGRAELWRALRLQSLRPRAWLALLASYIGRAPNEWVTRAVRRSAVRLKRLRAWLMGSGV